MLVLTTTTDELEVDLGEAHTTNALPVLVSYRDITLTAYTPGRVAVNTNGTTDVQILAGPAASTQRVVDLILINNRDTVAHNVTVRFVDNGTEFNSFQTLLAAGDILQYIDGMGWTVLSNNGSIKNALSQGSNSASSGLGVTTITADVVNNNGTANTIQDVTGLSFPVTSGQRYWFRFTIHYDAAATTTGSRWSINGPTFTDLNYQSQYTLTTTSITQNQSLSAYDTPAASNATSGATGSNMAVIEGFILPSANGTVIARFASEVLSSAITALRGSMVQFMAVG
jgi:hypothetical protein